VPVAKLINAYFFLRLPVHADQYARHGVTRRCRVLGA